MLVLGSCFWFGLVVNVLVKWKRSIIIIFYRCILAFIIFMTGHESRQVKQEREQRKWHPGNCSVGNQIWAPAEAFQHMSRLLNPLNSICTPHVVNLVVHTCDLPAKLSSNIGCKTGIISAQHVPINDNERISGKKGTGGEQGNSPTLN